MSQITEVQHHTAEGETQDKETRNNKAEDEVQDNDAHDNKAAVETQDKGATHGNEAQYAEICVTEAKSTELCLARQYRPGRVSDRATPEPTSPPAHSTAIGNDSVKTTVSPSVSGSTVVASPLGTKLKPWRDSSPSFEAHIDKTKLKRQRLDLLDVTIDDLVIDSYDKVRCFSQPDSSTQTFGSLHSTLEAEADKGRVECPDGSQWASLVEAGRNAESKGTLRYVMTTTAFSRWHASQVSRLENTSRKTDSETIFDRVLGPNFDGDVSAYASQKR